MKLILTWQPIGGSAVGSVDGMRWIGAIWQVGKGRRGAELDGVSVWPLMARPTTEDLGVRGCEAYRWLVLTVMRGMFGGSSTSPSSTPVSQSSSQSDIIQQGLSL